MQKLLPLSDEAAILIGILIAGTLAVILAGIVFAYLRRRQADDMEATLKMEMIQRGMSAAEIKQVIEAKMSHSGDVRRLWKEWNCPRADSSLERVPR